MNKNYAFVATLMVALLVGAGWATGFFSSSAPDPEVLEVVQMREQAMKKIDAKNPKSWQDSFQGIRDKVKNFSDEQKRSLRASGRKFFMQKVDELLAMPAEEQRIEVDKWIDFMSSARKAREANEQKSAGGGSGPPGGGKRSASLSPAERDQRRKQMLDKTTPEMRAKMDQIKDIFNARLEERGMEPIGGPGGWR